MAIVDELPRSATVIARDKTDLLAISREDFHKLVRTDSSLALSLIAVPVVVRTTENMLRLVPGSLREAAFALGAPRWKVATLVTLRAAKSGVMTGLLLAVARISGETAPLLFTALNNQFFSTDMSKPMANLPVVIFQFAMSPYDNWIRLAWGGALLITLAVLLLNIVARLYLREKNPV
jgi:phosphate transport system permease protein